MIFSHFRKPTGMRKTRLGKRISVHRVPLDTSWFCPYCCATVDTAFVTLQRHRKQNAFVCSIHSSISYSRSPVPPHRELLIDLLCLLPRVRHVVPHLLGREAHRHGERIDGDAKDRDDEYVPAKRDDPCAFPEGAEVGD